MSDSKIEDLLDQAQDDPRTSDKEQEFLKQLNRFSVSYEQFEQESLRQLPGTPGGFILRDYGLFHVESIESPDSEGPNNVVYSRVSNYINVSKLTKTKDAKSWGVLVEFKNFEDKLCQKYIPRDSLARGNEVISELLLEGFFVLKCEQNRLCEYITNFKPQEIILETKRTGWAEKNFVLPTKIIGTQNAKLYFNSDDANGYICQGTLDEWKSQIGQYCTGNSRLIFGVSCAFAAPLLRLCDIEGGGFHIYGRTSTGKTTLLKVATSVCGNRDYMHSWRTTDNALESTAESHNDTLLVLDEVGQLPSSITGNVAYMLANGQGKGRFNHTWTKRAVKKWITLFLSSGEIDFQTHIAESRKTIKDGQEIRFISIPAVSQNSISGIFDNLHGFENGGKFAEHLNECTGKFYGVPLVQFLESLVVVKDEVQASFKRFFEPLRAKLPTDMESAENRAFKRFALVGFAGELATHWGITGWEFGVAKDAALQLFNEWRDNPDRLTETERLKRQVRLFFECNGFSKFKDITYCGTDDKVYDMAGYFEGKLGNKCIYWVYPEVLENTILKGFPTSRAKKKLVEWGWIEPDKDGTHIARKKQVPYQGTPRLYKFVSEMFLPTTD